MVLFLNNQSHSDRDFKVLDRLSISEEVIFLRLNGTVDRLFEVRFRKERGVAQSWPDSSLFFPNVKCKFRSDSSVLEDLGRGKQH